MQQQAADWLSWLREAKDEQSDWSETFYNWAIDRNREHESLMISEEEHSKQQPE